MRSKKYGERDELLDVYRWWSERIERINPTRNGRKRRRFWKRGTAIVRIANGTGGGGAAVKAYITPTNEAFVDAPDKVFVGAFVGALGKASVKATVEPFGGCSTLGVDIELRTIGVA